jgi:hypothetical protein
MSTRSQIVIKDEYDEQWFYRHSDGYPEGNLPALFKFMTWNEEGKIRRNVEQSSGWLVLIGADEYGYNYNHKTGKETRKKTVLEPSDGDLFGNWKYGAYEICPHKEPHGDIEWLYIIDIEKNTLTIKEVRYNYRSHTLSYDELKAFKGDYEALRNEFFPEDD